MSNQTSVDIDFVQAFAGLVGDLRTKIIEGKLGEGTIRFGIGLVAGTDLSRQVKEVAADTDTFRGFAVHKHKARNITTDVTVIADEEGVDVLRQGVIWCPVETTVAVPAIDVAVFLNVAVVGAELGRVTQVSTANLATGGIFKQLATGPDGEDLALVEINLP